MEYLANFAPETEQDKFSENVRSLFETQWLISLIDECHHGTANTYKKLLEYFKPKFTLGLTATPERTDGEDLPELFRNVYDERKRKGLFVEKKSSIFCKDSFTRKDVERNIFANPFKRFEDMRFMKRCREIEFVEFNKLVFKKLTKEDIGWIKKHCDKKLGAYYGRYI